MDILKLGLLLNIYILVWLTGLPSLIKTHKRQKGVIKVGITECGDTESKSVQALVQSKVELLLNASKKVSVVIFSFWANQWEFNDKRIGVNETPLFSQTKCIYNPDELSRPLTKQGKYSDVIREVLKAYWYILATKFGIVPRRLKVLQNCDYVVTSGGDNLTTNNGIPVANLLNICVAQALGKDVIQFGESVGAFESSLLKKCVFNVLRRSSVVGVRDPISYRYLLSEVPEFGGRAKLIPDSAFALKPVKSKRIETWMRNNLSPKKEIISVALSYLTARKAIWHSNFGENYQEFVRIFANVLDRIISKYNVQIILIPNVVQYLEDDTILCRDIKNTYANKYGFSTRRNLNAGMSLFPFWLDYQAQKFLDKEIIIVEENFSAGELKYLISKTDAFIGSRLHACVAAVSSNVPTLGISFDTRVNGIIGEMMGLSEWICDIRDGFGEDELYASFESLYSKRFEIREKLEGLNRKAKIELKSFTKSIIGLGNE